MGLEIIPILIGWFRRQPDNAAASAAAAAESAEEAARSAASVTPSTNDDLDYILGV